MAKIEQNNLLNIREVLKELALNKDDNAWRQGIKPLLIERYGMRRIPGGGHRILRARFNHFINDYKEGKIFN